MSPLAVDERQMYSALAMQILGRFATDPQFDFYDLRSSGVAAALGSPTSGSREAELAVLSGLGTPSSQAALADLATAPSVSQAARLRAAEAFADSVQRFGTRLSRESVALQYHRYNQATDPDVRLVLGKLLDTMEQRIHAAAASSPAPPAGNAADEPSSEAATGSEM